MNASAGSPLLEARGIVKRYSTVLANDQVDFDLRTGEVHALLGENGAGKSTLSKILYGFSRPDAGEILFAGRQLRFSSPRDARALGIGMVFQNFTLIPAMSVLENIALFLPDLKPVVSEGGIARRIAAYSSRFQLAVDPSAQVRQLAIGDQQKVEILKLLLADARVLILDEPTKVLAPHEVEALFRIFSKLKAEGYAILFITHKLREVLACADRITVMRQGRVTGTLEAGRAKEASLISLMFGGAAAGRSTGGEPEPNRRPGGGSAATKLLELRGACTLPSGSETALRSIDLAVREGEIVGVAGVSGNGQKELGDLVLGLRPPGRGRKILWGKDASAWSIARVRQSGVAFVPEDPLRMASVAGMTVRENLALGTGRRYRRGASIDWGRVETDMVSSFNKLQFPLPPLEAPIRTLSGGNLQRAVVARELAHDPRLIVALYATRGLDVMSALAVRKLFVEARAAGSGILLISEDLEELFELSDRLVVLFRGAIVGEFPAGDYSYEEVGQLMTGSRGRG